MADGYDRFDNESTGGGSFVMGLLTGTVLGAGLGMLFAPKSGSELRSQISEQAGNIANTASEQYRRATETAGEWAEKGREVGRDVYDKARDAVARGTDEAQRYVRDATSGATKTTPPAGSSSSTFGTGSAYGGESIRGSSTEHPRGGPSSGPTGGGSRRS
jgi:gas vesicle protein